MMSIVSNTRVDIVARGVIKACLELGKDPGETIAIFRIPGAWEEEGFKILDRYGIEYCDRSVSLWEAAGRAVAKIQGSRRMRQDRLGRIRAARISLGVQAWGLLPHLRGGVGCPAPIRPLPQPAARTISPIPSPHCHEHPDQPGHDVHHPGHHRARGRQPHTRVPGLRLEDRRRRDPRPQGPRGPRRAGVRHRRAARRAQRGRRARRLGRHRPPRGHARRRVRGAARRHQDDRDRHRADPAPRRRDDGRAGRRQGRADHRPQLPRRDRPGRRQDGRHRRPGTQRRRRLPARRGRRDEPLRRHDHGDLLHADGRGTRGLHRGIDRRRRDHRLDLRRADAVLRGRRADARRS